MRLSLLVPIACFGLFSNAAAQDSKGTDFWLMFNSNNSTPLNITLFITSSVNTSGTVSGPSFTSIPFTVVANTVTSVALSTSLALHSSNIIDNKGIHVTALQEVTVYGVNRLTATTDAFLGLPTDVLGTNYRVLTYSGNAGVSFGVVGTVNGTTVTITPSVTASPRTAGVPYNITLNQGEAYQLMNTANSGDLSGTLITSNQPIGVFGAHRCTNIPVGCGFCDHIVEMLPPTSTWGKKFAAVPLVRTLANGDQWKIIASDNTTTVTINGVAQSPVLNAGQFMERNLTVQSIIEADKPVLVAQYARGGSCSGQPGDPFMMLIPPYEQFLANYTVSTVSGFTTNYINIVAPNAIVGTMTRNGIVIPAGSFTAIGTSGFSGAQITVATGSHTLNGSLPFGCFTYGFNNSDSYGYAGGQSFSSVANVTTVDLTPATGTSITGINQCWQTLVKDQNNNPLSGVRVDYVVTGVNPQTSFSFTNGSGISTFCYTGTNVGNDNITASVGTLADAATFDWTPCISPTITCPANITVSSTAGQCGANVSFAATATGSPVISFTYSPASGSFFALGTTTVNATATNTCGSASCTFTVTVNPNAEICNGIDDDCDGLIDDLDSSVTGQPTWYADADLDGFGNPAVSITACIQPSGYLANSTDCDDTDSLEHPGQVWYTDNDADDFGTGAFVVQCLRPTNGYIASELVSTTGDCNDNNASINPASQTLSYSGAANFTTSLVNPLNGTGYTNFAFEVLYTDATNSLPPPTFPRVLLDYEGNGVFNNVNDRVVIMSEYDVNDVTTSNGKRYIGTINSLTAGTNWQTRVQIVNGACLTQIGPFNYPDVLILPDLQIFANDITFSAANPPVSSPQTITAVIHNVSDFAAQNFYVHLVNQYDNSSPADILVSNLAPHSSTTVSWIITTPSVPAWCPMQVTIDYTNAIAESNELDNSAMRPFINGNFNLPGGIVVVNAGTSPSVSYTSAGGSITISGRGLYYGTPVPLADSSVAGGTISFIVTQTNATYTTYTNSQGYFSLTIPAPAAVGTYNITGSLTDFTFTGNWSTQFTMIPPPACLPDLRANVIVSSHNIIAGNSISGSITVSNNGCLATTVNTVLDISQSGGTPVLNDVTVPPLAVNGTYTTTFSSLTFATAGTYSICGTADATFLVTESNESNNTDCEVITVIPAMPDIYPAGGPCCTAHICNSPANPSFTVGNSGGAATGAFTCDIVVRLNNTIVTTLTHAISNIGVQSSTSFSVSYNYPSVGYYTFELKCDVPLPNGIVVETNENNNSATYGITILDCKPDLVLSTDCELFDVQPVDPQFPGTVTYVATMVNIGNATATGPIDVRFHQSGGTDYDMQYMGNLAPGQSTVVSVTAASVAPATQTLTATADYLNTIVEWNESNSISNSLCWDFQPVPMYYPCGTNFWDQSYLVNQTAYLSVGLRAFYLYDASSVKVRFQVSGPGLTGTITLGDASVNNVQQTCYCPRTAICPVNFAFPQEGTYTFTMTADPDADYTECAENNNILVVNVVVTGVPDMRILSQHINPSMLNPQPNQSISLDITYENMGVSNITAQMELRVLVDEIPLDSVYPVYGLVTGDNATISIPATWSSNTPGAHIIRAKIDSDNQVTESNETNNEATRAIVVGETANLYFQVFASSNPVPSLNSSININARIGNNGDIACDADVQFFYLTNTLDTIPIGVIHVSVDDNDSTTIQLQWTVLDPTTTLIGRIVNSSVLEYTYDDNQATTVIGAMSLSFASTQNCIGVNNGTLTANTVGGEPPYSYLWNNSFNAQTLTAGAGSYSVIVTDATGQNVSGSGTIANENVNPTITCPANINNLVATSASGVVVNYATPAGADNCSGATTVQTAGLSSGLTFPIGTTTNTFVVTDAASLTAQCSFTVEVIGLPPQIVCPANISVSNTTGQCGANVSYAATETTGIPASTITYSIAPGSFFAVGTTYTVTATATNTVGTSTCTFDVIVTDNENPAVTCPSNIPVSTDAGLCTSLVTYTVTSGDNCSGSTFAQTAGLISGSAFPKGTTTNTFVVTDASNNTATCSFDVIVSDNEIPTIYCPANIPVNTDAGLCTALVTYTVTSGDNCSGSTFAQTAGLISGSAFPKGTTTNTFVVTDASNNTATCSFDVIVSDNENPTVGCPANIPVNTDAGICTALVTYSVTSGDNCSGSTFAQTAGLISGSAFPKGTTTNTFVVTDASNNTATCSFNIIVSDTENPVISGVGTGATIDCPSSPMFSTPTVSDNCSGATLAHVDATTVGCGNTYTTTRTWTATDAANNSVTASQTIVVRDITPPTVSSVSSMTVECDGAGNTASLNSWLATRGGGSATDACSNVSWSNNFSALSDLCGATGSATVIFTATDDCNNVSSASATFTIADNTAPAVSSVTSMNVECDGAGNTSALNSWLTTRGGGSATDACSNVSWSNNFSALSDLCGATGAATVTFTATDECGNTANASATFTIGDATNPTITSCPANITVNCQNATSVSALGNATATDVCSGVSVTHGDAIAAESSSTYGNYGAYNYVITRTFTATDDCGNYSNSVQVITVHDVNAPTLTCSGNLSGAVNNAGCTRIFTYSVTTSDNCSPVTVTQTSGLPSGSAFPKGVTTNSFVATDASGNSSVCSFIVTVTSNLAVNAGSDEQTYYGYNLDQTVNRTVTATGGGGGYSYSWSLSRPMMCNIVNSTGDEVFSGGTCVNNACPTTGSPSVAPVCTSTTGSVSAKLIDDANVCVTVTDAFGCTATDCFHINSIDARCFAGNSNNYKIYVCHHTGSNTNPWVQICIAQPAVPAHLAHNNLDCIGLCPCGTRLDNATASSDFGMAVYPNPSSNNVNVEFDSETSGAYELTMFDITGRVVLVNNGSVFIGGNRIQLPVSGIVEGIYNLRLSIGDKSAAVRLVVTK